jgi:hypothetical protein
MCMVGDDDWWDFFTSYHPKAKQDHRCGECQRTISKGETYWTMGGKHDGEFVWFKTCEHCQVASDWLQVVCDGWLFQRREEDFWNHVLGDESEIRTWQLTRLFRWMRADWRDRVGNLRPIEDVQALTDSAISAWRAQLAQAA